MQPALASPEFSMGASGSGYARIPPQPIAYPIDLTDRPGRGRSAGATE